MKLWPEFSFAARSLGVFVLASALLAACTAAPATPTVAPAAPTAAAQAASTVAAVAPTVAAAAQPVASAVAAVAPTVAAAAQPAASAVAAAAPTVVAAASAVAKPASGEPYRIGAVLSVTGFNSALGSPERDTLQMLADDLNAAGGINGRPVQMTIYDSQSDNTTAVTLVKRLLDQDKVMAVIGSSASGETLAFANTIDDAQIPDVSLAAAAQIIQPVRKWMFTTASSNFDSVGAVIKYLKSKNLSKIAVLNSTNGFGADGKAVWEKLGPENGITLVDEESFTDNDTDMTTQLTKIKGTDAQAIAVWGNNPAQTIVAKNYQQLGLKAPLIFSHSAPSAQFLQQAGDAANGVIMPTNKITAVDLVPASDPQKPVLDSYAQRFRAKYNRAPDQFGGHSYDAFQIVVDSIKRGGTTPATLRDQIEATKNYVGVSGIFNYGPDNHAGMTPDALLMVTVQNGKFVLVQ